MATAPKPSALTGWERIDLTSYAAGYQEPDAVALDRADGICLLYGGKVTAITGEPEAGKGWLAGVVVADALADGMAATYIDFEGEPTTLAERLLAMGVAPTAFGRLAYHRPNAPMTPRAISEVLLLARQLKPFVTVIDGVNAAMGASGLDSNKSADFYSWWNQLGHPLQTLTSGPTLTIDHVVKNPDNRHGYPSGTLSKQAAIDVHLGLELVAPFGIGLTGRTRLVLQKDRCGRLRTNQAAGNVIGFLVLESDAKTRAVRFMIEPPDATAKRFRPTTLMERVSIHLERAAAPATKRQIRSAVSGKESAIVAAVDCLHEEGYIKSETQGRYPVFHSEKPYRQATDPVSGASGAQWCPRGAGHHSAGVVPLIHTEGTTTAAPPNLAVVPAFPEPTIDMETQDADEPDLAPEQLDAIYGDDPESQPDPEPPPTSQQSLGDITREDLDRALATVRAGMQAAR